MSTLLNTANTLSVAITPGEDKLRPNTSVRSIFTFGDYRVEEPLLPGNVLNLNAYGYPAKSFSNANFLDLTGYNINRVLQVQSNEVNFDTRQPNSYAYFSSFYTKVANAINSIVNTFPYAILSERFGLGNNITNISYDNFNNVTSFFVDEASLINQGSVFYKSGDTNNLNVYYNFDKFALQISGQTNIYEIKNYNYDSISQELYFEAYGRIFTGNSINENINLYIRPSEKRLSEFENIISQLEYQILYEGKLFVPSEDYNEMILSAYTWPKTIDGFNPDSTGGNFDLFVNSLVKDANLIDEVKTNIFFRAIIPENLIDLDSQSQIFKKLMYVFADEFDKLKKFIDIITYAHSINYNRIESVPNVFLQRLANLLGAKLTDSFSNVDFFKYIAGVDGNNTLTYREYNLDLWTKILVNINHLYKRKGTRDPIMFMFKLLGAPDCLVRFNEFVYKVENTASSINQNNQNSNFSSQIGFDGYPDIDANPNIFQAGGSGRGNGQAFIDFYDGAYDLVKTVDNVKTYSGSSSITSTTISTTRDLVNTKEVDIFLDPAQVIECDVKNWYSLGYGFWNWGTTGTCVSPFSAISFSSLTVPFEYTIDGATCSTLIPSSITAMTISEYVDYVYSTFINPRNRKIVAYYNYTTSIYPNLKKIYLNYMFWGGGFQSNQLEMKDLEGLLDIIEKGFVTLGNQFIPSTTITNGPATVYRNTVFNRQKFVYKPGINDGSEFKRKLPPDFIPKIITNVITPKVNNVIKEIINVTNTTANVNNVLKSNVVSNQFNAFFKQTVSGSNSSQSISCSIIEENLKQTVLVSQPVTNPILFPIQ